jgi:predicted aldo/keto reductase-like oxidoreductase
MMEIPRREFLMTLAAAGVVVATRNAPVALAASEDSPGVQGIPLTPIKETRKGDMIYRQLGKTGEEVSLIGMGGSHIGQLKQEQDSIRLIRDGIDRGITFMDNSWDYHNGKSEIWMGKALRDGYRNKVFLMSKIDGRSKEEAAKQIDESLLRLGADHVDLMQFHEIIRPHDPDMIFAEGGAFEAMVAARKAGKVRFIGFTGHKDPFIHLRMLEMAKAHNFRFDTVQMPLNVMDAHFRSFQKQVLPVLVSEQIGVLGMKSMGSPYIIQSKVVTPMECLHYAMTLPTSVVITGIDKPEILNQAIEAAKTFKPMAQDQITDLLKRTEQIAMTGKTELFKTSMHFDSTAKHPEWLGPEELRGPSAPPAL